MSNNNHNVPSFDSVNQLRTVLEQKGTQSEFDLYPRDGTRKLYEIEARLAELAGVEPHELILCSSGMAAVVAAFESCVSAESTVACAWQTYSQTAAYVHDHLAAKGVKVVFFDSGNPQEADRVIRKHRPDVIFSETISNGPDMPVLDTEALYASCDNAEIAPTILLDNTLPLSSGYDITSGLSQERKVVVIESATKSYAFNSELAGILYSKNEQCVSTLRKHRCTKGFGPNLAALDRLETLVPRSHEVFDQRNRRIFKATSSLACAASVSIQEQGEFIVSHPSVQGHPNYPYSLSHLRDGSSPVFFIQCIGSTDQYQLTQQLWEHPKIKSRAELGQSFGFDKARILPNSSYPMVRIAAGAYDDVEVLSGALAEVLSKRPVSAQ